MTRARRTAARICLTIAACGAAITAAYAADAYPPVRSLRFANASGWLAGSLLTLALCVTPAQRLLARAGRLRPVWLTPLRRSLGIAAASCGLAHAVYALLVVPGIAGLVVSVPWLRAGLLTLCILWVLLLTSFDGVLRRLRLQHWKELHRLVYPATLVLALHVLLGPYGSTAIEVTFFAALSCLLMLRFLPTHADREESAND
jgi:methionine sulfoxide reductase heme-binding subunit